MIKTIIATIIGILIVGGGYMVLKPQLVPTGGYAQSATTYLQTATSGVMAITSSAQILATSTRLSASICNPTSTLVYLNMDADKVADATTGATVIIAGAAGYEGCYQIDDQNLYQGAIQASSTGASVDLFISEYKSRH